MPSPATSAAATAKPPRKPLFAAIAHFLRSRQHLPNKREFWHDAYAKAVTELRNDPRAQMSAGDRALAAGMNQVAVACYQRAVDLSPGNVDALQGLAIALTVAGKNEQALPIFRKLIELDDGNKVARFNYAVALTQLDRLDEAVKQYGELLAKDADYFAVAAGRKASGPAC